jgi:hypothetical protein
MYSVSMPRRLRNVLAEYAAFTQLEALDMSVLGRDIMEVFAVLVDRSGDVVTLIRQPHRYAIETRQS